MEKISVKIIADLNDVVVYEQDKFKRYLIFFQDKKIGYISDRDDGVAIQHKVKFSWKMKRISTIDDFYIVSKEITKGKQTRKSTTKRKPLERKVATGDVSNKILAWMDKHNRYDTEVSVSELGDGIGEVGDTIVAGISNLFKSHKVLQMKSSRFVITKKIDISKLPTINVKTNYHGETKIIGSKNKKALLNNIKRFSGQKKQCNDCGKFVPKYEIHKGLCSECR